MIPCRYSARGNANLRSVRVNMGRRSQKRVGTRSPCTLKPIRRTDCKKAAVVEEVKAFAPATIANFGPGFDWLGCAVEGDGDIVIAKATDIPGVKIEFIEGDQGKLSLNPESNCVGIAAMETLKLLGTTSNGVSLTLKKGLPLGSGLGSSAASAAASAWAVNCLFGQPLTKNELIYAGLKSEESVSGYHADNVAPAILGGFVIIESMHPLKLVKLDCPHTLYFALVTPKFQAPTAEMRAALPAEVPMKSLINNSCMAGLLITGILTGDSEKMGHALNSDLVIEPSRGPLIPGFHAVKQAAIKAGAFGCTISGAGPTVLALVENEGSGRIVLEEMCQAFKETGNLEIQKSQIVQTDNTGAKQLMST